MKMHNVSGQVKVASGNVPNAGAAGTVTGSAIDRLGYESAVLHVATGAVSGAPSAQTCDAKITECDTSGGSYTDVAGAAITQITAGSTEKTVAVDLRGCKQYLKVVATIALTDGTTPKMPFTTTLVLGGAAVEPTT